MIFDWSMSRGLKCTIVIMHCPSSVVRPFVRPSSLTFHIFDFSSERNTTKLDRKQDLNVFYPVFVFRDDWKNLWNRWTKLDGKQNPFVLYQDQSEKNKTANPFSNLLRHYRVYLWICWTEFTERWQEARSQRPLLSLCFRADQSTKMDALADPSKRWHTVLRCTHCVFVLIITNLYQLTGLSVFRKLVGMAYRYAAVELVSEKISWVVSADLIRKKNPEQNNYQIKILLE